MTLPNLVIAGAPKCGTSSLFSWLADHPEACGSTVKETFYLMDEGHPLRRKHSNYQAHGLAGYQSYFHKTADHRIVFEATTHYLYQQTALEVLSNLDPLPQIVFLLRKPSDRVYSSFQYSKHNLGNVDREVSFAQFVNDVRNPSENSAFDQYAGESAYVLKHDIQYSRYIEYISRWISRCGSDRIHVLLFEELKREPRRFMQQLARRLGIDPTFYDAYDFPVKNETINVRNPSLQRSVRRINEIIPGGRVKTWLKGAYLKAQTGPAANGRTPEDRQILAELEQEFQPFNRQLADQLGLDLSVWN